MTRRMFLLRYIRENFQDGDDNTTDNRTTNTLIDDDEDDDLIANLACDWNSDFEYFQEELCGVQTETIINQLMENNIIQLNHSDVSECWQNNQYPYFNDPNFKK